ncbi:hypothetical protein [Ferviditalea candida]|uniref:Uncharacterized protein n=1 Tax=Ferviditalea candida TaxID=3108399 RepID=A0ABU5ZKM5_9BACL|nr:hypothetical protein [Paenibacillaceae bacterium T2]
MSDHRNRELIESWESFRYHIKDRLISLDNMTRAMVSEMETLGVPQKLVREKLPDLFAELWAEVAAEQSEKYDQRRRTG